MLKTDGSWGGRGVAILRGESDGRKAWREMRRRPPLARALKRLVVARDPWDLRALMAGTRPTFSIQSYVAGRPANAAVACFRGTTLAAVQAEVIESAGKTGPSTVLRLIENPDMAYAVKSVVNNLELSGLCGLDFILDDGGRAHLIELNPRATPTSHLVTPDGTDPLTALRAAFGDDRRARAVRVVPERPGGAVSPGTASRPGQPEPPARPPRRTVARAGPRRPRDGRSARTATDGATFGRGSRAGGRHRLMRQQLKQETGKEAVKRNGMDRSPGASSGSRWVVNVNVHGVGPLPSRPMEDGEDQVWISVEQLEGLLDAAVGRPDVTITFDDGNLSDLELGLPRLQERGLKARFYVCAGLLGEPGRLDEAGVRELHHAGMVIGSHGWAHRDWRSLDWGPLGAVEVEEEMVRARRRIGKLIGTDVSEVAVPFGSYDRHVVRALRRTGVTRIYTSDGGWARSRRLAAGADQHPRARRWRLPEPGDGRAARGSAGESAATPRRLAKRFRG